MRSRSLARHAGVIVCAGLLMATSTATRCRADGSKSVKLQLRGELDHTVAQGISDASQLLIVGATAAMLASEESNPCSTGQRAADALIVTAVANSLLKRATNLPRPRSDNPRLVALGLGPPPDGHGFPSGHTSAAFAFATVMADEEGDAGLWYGMAAAVGWSRVEVHAHHIWDVVAGAALGTCLARRSLRSDGGLLQGVGIKPKRIELGDATLTLGLDFSPGCIDLVSLEF